MSQQSPLTAAQNHARTLRAAGDLVAARTVLEAALESGRGAYGADHPDVLATAHLLAGVHRDSNDPAGARRVLEEALAAAQRRFPDTDPLILAISFDLGSVAEELGNRHEARRNYGRVAAAGPAVLGEDHWTVRAARDYLGGQSLPAAAYEERTPSPAVGAPLPPQAGSAPAPPQAGGTPHLAPAVDPWAVPVEPWAGADPFAVTLPPSAPVPAQQTVAPPTRGRGWTVLAAVAATVAAVVASVAAVVVLIREPAAPSVTGGGGATPGPTVSGDPPVNVRLRDDGEIITVSWADPGNGGVSFLLTAGRENEEQLRILASLSPGETRYSANGLNPKLNYCFVVVAMYGADAYAPSERVCTARATGATSTSG